MHCSMLGLHLVVSRRKLQKKSGSGKRAPWVLDLHRLILEEFQMLSKLVVKFNTSLIRKLTLKIIERGDESLSSFLT